MARFREYSYDQAVMLPVALGRQLQPGSFEYAINHLVEHCIDRSVFEERYANDETGAPAIDPAILLKIVLFAYSRGIVSSRTIARACEENVIFMALSADTRPHFATIANFISSMDEVIIGLFRDVLTICYAEGLIGRQMFAIDGCKISSNCSKEWSGTKKELLKKAEKIISWTAENEDRIGRRGKPVKSNITDNESAKLVSSHGVIQGYNGIATVDAKHQIVVDAQAFGDVHEAAHVREIIESVAAVLDAEIDAYIADAQFRKRDPPFADQQKHKAKTTDRKQTSKARTYFTAEQFTFNDEGILICPAGKPMKSSCPNWKSRKGYTGRTFKGYPEHCGNCPVRDRCLRSPNSPVRQVTKTEPGIRHNKKSAVARMMERFTLRGRSKVDAQWKLFCIVHNIGKLARYGPSFAGATM